MLLALLTFRETGRQGWPGFPCSTLVMMRADWLRGRMSALNFLMGGFVHNIHSFFLLLVPHTNVMCGYLQLRNVRTVLLWAHMHKQTHHTKDQNRRLLEDFEACKCEEIMTFCKINRLTTVKSALENACIPAPCHLDSRAKNNPLCTSIIT